MPSDDLVSLEVLAEWGEEFTSLPVGSQAIFIADNRTYWRMTGKTIAWGTMETAIQFYANAIRARGSLADYIKEIMHLYTEG